MSGGPWDSRRPAAPPCSAAPLKLPRVLVFAEALPGGLEPGPDDSRSYAEWLGQLPGTDSDADT